MLSKEKILSKPKEYYEELIDYTAKEYYAPWVLERLWEKIFKEN